jgi:hypothetical protein
LIAVFVAADWQAALILHTQNDLTHFYLRHAEYAEYKVIQGLALANFLRLQETG